MFHLVPATSNDPEPFCRVRGFEVDPDVLARQRPDALWLLLDRDAPADAGGADQPQCAARCALWWDQTPPYVHHRLGLMGHYFARDAVAGVELLCQGCAELAARGCTLAVGPMDGSTWQRYRLITERGTEPLFFLEPDNPDDWPLHFTTAGFSPLAQYYSAATTDLATEDARLPAVAARLEADGVRVRPLRRDRPEEELRVLFALSAESFRDNFLYTPIREQDFLDQYQRLWPVVRPEFVFLAEQGSTLVGFLFAVPDYLQEKLSQRPIDTVIAKTMAVHPDHRGTGLGSLLMARCHEAARRGGFRRVIHALFHEGNHSRKISGHTAHVFRRYTLFARPLEPRP
jgi:GNAT superfamily N-acetyltransferase